MNWKRAFFIAAALLLVSNGWWAFTVIDRAVTDGYREVSHQDTRADLATMQRLLPAAAPLTRADVVALLRRTHPDAFIVDDSTGVKGGGLALRVRWRRSAGARRRPAPVALTGRACLTHRRQTAHLR